MPPVKISVVIINYNYADYVPLAIQSVLNQTLPPDQIIVVDDGSTDNSVNVISSLVESSNVIFHRKMNGGQLSAVRSGINLAEGDWIFFLDSDDEWTPDHLQQARHCIAGNPDVSLYFSNHQETAGPPIFRSKWPAGKFGPCSGLVVATGTRIGTIESTLGLRADKARDSISFDHLIDEKWRMRAEDCLIFGASLSGAIAYYNPEQTVNYRIHGNNSFAHKDRSQEEQQYQLNKNELFIYWSNRYGISSETLQRLISTELNAHTHNIKNITLKRRSRRAARALFRKAILVHLKKIISKS